MRSPGATFGSSAIASRTATRCAAASRIASRTTEGQPPEPRLVEGTGTGHRLLTQASVESMRRAIAQGWSFDNAATLAGVSHTALKKWLRRGRRELLRQERGESAQPSEELYAALWMAVDQALAASEVRMLSIIDQCAQGGLPVEREQLTTASDGARVWTIERSKTLPNWLCAAWRLERRHPEKYARSVLKVRVQQHRQGNSPGPVIVLPPLRNDDEPEQE
jgi:hypothetical protein